MRAVDVGIGQLGAWVTPFPPLGSTGHHARVRRAMGKKSRKSEASTTATEDTVPPPPDATEAAAGAEETSAPAAGALGSTCTHPHAHLPVPPQRRVA